MREDIKRRLDWLESEEAKKAKPQVVEGVLDSTKDLLNRAVASGEIDFTQELKLRGRLEEIRDSLRKAFVGYGKSDAPPPSHGSEASGEYVTARTDVDYTGNSEILFEPQGVLVDTSDAVEDAWSRMTGRFKETTDDVNQDDDNLIRDFLDSIPNDYDRLRAKKKWKLMYNIWDALKRGLATEDELSKLLWVNAEKSREQAETKIKDHLKEFASFPEIAPIIERAEYLMSKPMIHFLYVSDDGSVSDIRYWDYAGGGDLSADDRRRTILVGIDEERFFSQEELDQLKEEIEIKARRGNKIDDVLYDIQTRISSKTGFRGMLPQFMDLLKHDVKSGKVQATRRHIRYAEMVLDLGKKYDPDRESLDIINKKIVTTPDSVFGAVAGIIFIGELRFKYFADRYGKYISSPIDFDPSPVFTVNPLSRIYYNIRAYGRIPEGWLKMWCILKPSRAKEQEGWVKAERLVTKGSIVTNKVSLGTSSVLFPVGSDGEIFKRFVVEQEKNAANWRSKEKYPLLKNEDEDYWYQYVPDFLPPNANFSPASVPPGLGSNTLNFARGNDNVLKALVVRGIIKRKRSSSFGVFAPVEMASDDWLILPPLWDVLVKGNYNITYKEYLLRSKAWKEFQAFMESTSEHEINKPTDIGIILDKATKYLSKIKGLFNQLDSKHAHILKQVVFQYYLWLIKDMYDNFDAKTAAFDFKGLSYGTSFTPRGFFLNEVATKLNSLGTLDSEIRRALITFIKKHSSSVQLRKDFFSDAEGVLAVSWIPGRQKREEYMLANLTSNLTAPPASQEEKEGK